MSEEPITLTPAEREAVYFALIWYLMRHNTPVMRAQMSAQGVAEVDTLLALYERMGNQQIEHIPR